MMVSSLAPTGARGRIEELDVLRGFALFGVFIVHFVGVNFYELPMPEAVRASWEASPLQHGAAVLSDVFFQNKANTLFATLFGMGFWLMIERLRARADSSVSVYLRRLTVLLFIGAINLFLIIPGDVLFEYALLGFALYALRGLPAWAMLALGIGLAFFGEPLGDQLAAALSSEENEGPAPEGYGDDLYWYWVVLSAQSFYQNNIVGAGGAGWMLYLFGRFLIGAWIMRQAWAANLSAHRSVIGRVAMIAVPVGVLLETASLLIFKEWVPGPSWVEQVCHAVGAPLLAAGYAALLVFVFTSAATRGWVSWFAPVGRMALTSYIAHGLVLALIFLPLGPELTGVVTPVAGMGIAIGLFLILTIFSALWLRGLTHGPLEYLWRWATYGTRPQFRRLA
ncbi:MAG: DUF418 domain-containing protein [Pseudomonadota bacterium]